jgi:hypothetical protein
MGHIGPGDLEGKSYRSRPNVRTNCGTPGRAREGVACCDVESHDRGLRDGDLMTVATSRYHDAVIVTVVADVVMSDV